MSLIRMQCFKTFGLVPTHYRLGTGSRHIYVMITLGNTKLQLKWRSFNFEISLKSSMIGVIDTQR